MELVGRLVREPFPPTPEEVLKVLGAAGYAQPVVVDMSRMLFVDSSGISWLIVCHKRFAQTGGKLVFHSLTPAVRTLLETMGLHHVFQLAPNLDEALAAARLSGVAPG